MHSDKKRIVFIVGSFYPLPSAVGICAEKIITRLSDSHDVSVISLHNENNINSESSVADGYRIERVVTRFSDKLLKLKNLRSIPTVMRKALIFSFKVKRVFDILCNSVTIDNDIVDSYFSMLSALNDKDKIDVIIPCCFPFETILASLKFKELVNKNVLVIPYMFDNFSNSASLHRYNFIRRWKFNKNMALEEAMLRHSDGVIAMHPLKEHFETFIKAPELLKKISYTEHPLLEMPTAKDISSRNSICTFNYSGGLFKGVREPAYMLNLMQVVSYSMSIKFDIYAFGSACHEVSDFCKKNNFATFHGQVSRQVILDAYSKVDVLLNLGEVEGKQISSKIFEYMSMGKPIIHIEFIKSCVVSQILACYPLALVINTQEEMKSAAMRIVDFLNVNAKNRLDFCYIQNIYNDATPEFTVNKFKEIFIDGDVSG